MIFDNLKLKDFVKTNVRKMGLSEMFEIQFKAIPAAMLGKDILGQSKTGSGKTLAFAIPIVQKLDENSRNVQALILTPTRELAQQDENVFKQLIYGTHLRSVCIYGGASIYRQAEFLRRGAQIVVGTPGRIIDQIQRGNLILRSVRTVVLDEADRMLDMGFSEDVETIISETPKQRQMLLFSATMPPEIMHLVKKYMKDYETINVSQDQLTVEGVKQYYIEAKRNEKVSTLTRLLKEKEALGQILVFCRTKRTTDWLVDKLQQYRVNAMAIHGDLSQNQRDRVIQMMRAGRLKVLVATDVAARGLDLDIGVVINYDISDDPKDYVHRIGRTARAGRTGEAISIITDVDHGALRDIIRALKIDVQPIESELKTFSKDREDVRRSAPRFNFRFRGRR